MEQQTAFWVTLAQVVVTLVVAQVVTAGQALRAASAYQEMLRATTQARDGDAARQRWQSQRRVPVRP